MILYHCFNARSFRALWALEATGAPYELKMLPFPPRVRQRAYLEVNPLGTIPCMLLDDDPAGRRMTESAAIAQYVADRFDPGGLSVRPDEPDYGPYLNWLHFGEATLTFPQTLVLRYRRLEPPERRVEQAAVDYGKWFLARARAVGPALEKPYICAGRFTAADISMAYAFLLAGQVGLADELPEPAKAYWARMQAEPSYAKAQAAQREAAKAQGVDVGGW
jgi:glutathione S-transferase